jgi:type I restriction enzyme S subunit
MGDVATIDRDGISPFDFPDEQFEHFSIPAFDDGRTPVVEAGEAIRSNKYCINEACVLLSKLNPRIPRVWMPSPTDARRAITSTEFLVLKPKSGFSREFFFPKWCSDEFAGQFASLAIGTSTSHQRVRPENVLAIPSAVPGRAAVEQFTNHVAPMLAASEKLRSKVQYLRRTRDLLLPRLLSGQIDLEAMPS